MAKDSRVMSEKCRTFMQHVASGGNHVPAIDVIHRWVHKKWSCGRWISRRSIVDNCSCHDCSTAVAIPGQLQLPCLDRCSCHAWTTAVSMPGQTAVAMYNQMWLQCLNNRGWQVWTNLCGMVGPLHVPCWTNYSCHAMTNCYHDRRLLRWNHIGKHLMASFTVAGKRYCR